MKFTLCALAVASLLAACGGGDDDDVSSGPAPVGLWQGTTSNGRAQTVLILSDGTFWGLYSAVGNSSVIGGVVQGNYAASTKAFSTTNARDYNLEGFGVVAATASGTYTPKTSLSGRVTYPSGTIVSGELTYDPIFEQAPSLTALAGTFTGQVASSAGVQSGSATINSAGNVAGSSAGCSYTGTLTPRTDGNAFDLSVTFGGSPCIFAGQTLTGVAVYDAANKRLYAAAPNAARTNGFLVLATKP